MKPADAIFWDRLADMPAWEAEQECVNRRESLVAENAQAMSRRQSAKGEQFVQLGKDISYNAAQLTRLNERIRYVRKLQDRTQWKSAVLALYGEDAVADCITWIELQYQEIHGTRRQWARKATV